MLDMITVYDYTFLNVTVTAENDNRNQQFLLLTRISSMQHKHKVFTLKSVLLLAKIIWDVIVSLCYRGRSSLMVHHVA